MLVPINFKNINYLFKVLDFLRTFFYKLMFYLIPSFKTSIATNGEDETNEPAKELLTTKSMVRFLFWSQ